MKARAWPRLALAGLLLATAAIHLALVPDHFGESTPMGIGFVGAGGAQVALALLVVLGPQRVAYLAVGLTSAALVTLYAYNVLVGLPFAGEHLAPVAGHSEEASDAADAEHDPAASAGGEAAGAGHEADGHEAPGDEHGAAGLRLGAGEAVDGLGAGNLAIELACIGLAGMLLVRSPSRAAARRPD